MVLGPERYGFYSVVLDKPLKQKRVAERPTVDGESVLQALGFRETKIYRFFWITTAELQDEIQRKEEETADGWIITGEIGRTPIHDALDLYNAVITMQRMVSA